jgi:hypothetical protein
MKRLFMALIALMLTISMFGFSAFAADETPTVTEGNTTETIENTPETSENSSQASNSDIVGEVMAIVTDGEMWAKLGITVGGIIAFILAISSKFNEIVSAFGVVNKHLEGKATREEAEAAVKSAVEGVKARFDENASEMNAKYAALEEKYNKQTAVLTLLALQLVKSPNARVQIMELIQSGKQVSEDVSEVVEAIEAEIEAADAAEPKPDTPALDAVTELVSQDVMRLG